MRESRTTWNSHSKCETKSKKNKYNKKVLEKTFPLLIQYKNLKGFFSYLEWLCQDCRVFLYFFIIDKKTETLYFYSSKNSSHFKAKVLLFFLKSLKFFRKISIAFASILKFYWQDLIMSLP